MKFWIVASSLADLHLTRITQYYDHEYCIFLDNRFGPWWFLSREDSVDRLHKVLSSEEAKSCDVLLLPPVYELHALQISDFTHAAKIIPLYTTYLQECVLPASMVGKIGLLAPLRHQPIFQRHREHMVKSHTLLPKQQNNRHFQKQFPLYVVWADHRDILYKLPRSRFVNKLIKLDLKKLKDYGIDTLVPTSYSHFHHEKVFAQAFHNKVKVHKRSSIEYIAKQLLSANESAYSVDIYMTGDSVVLDTDTELLWCLWKGKQHQVLRHKLSTM